MDGTLVRDFIPAKRISDGAVGMYDLVEGKFYSSATAANFAAGPEVSSARTIEDYGTVTYDWYSRNASTAGSAWTLIKTTQTNTTTVTVSTLENTQFSVNASNIAGSDDTSAKPVPFTVYTKITLDALGGTNSSQVVNITLGDTAFDKQVNASVKDGYLFNGWDAIASPKNLTVINVTGVLMKNVPGYTNETGSWINTTAGDLTLYANWTRLSLSYNIRYHTNNGTDTNITKAGFPSDGKAPLNSTAELGFVQNGYTFLNWTQYANGTGNSYAETEEVTGLASGGETADLYAVWRVNETHAVNTSAAAAEIGSVTYPKWSPAKEDPYVVGYNNLNGTAELGPFIIESAGAAGEIRCTLTADNLTASETKDRINVTASDGTKLAFTTDYTIEDRDGKGYINLTESGRAKTGLSGVSVAVKEYPLGDASINDIVDIVDSASVGIYVLKLTDTAAAQLFLPKENQIHGDVNHDGTVDVNDILMINRYLVGTEPLK